MTKMQCPIETIEQEIKELLQINNSAQDLDSLEVVVIKSYLRSRGLEEQSQLTPSANTIKGWLECLNPYFRDGQIIPTS